MIEIRKARLQDVWQLVRLAQEMHEESDYSRFIFDPIKLSENLNQLVNAPWGVVVVAVKDDNIVGALVGEISGHYFGPGLVASDWGFFITPSERKGLLAVNLLKAWIKEAKRCGADTICIANSTGVEIEKVKSLYEYVGFNHKGYVLHMDLK